MNDATEYYDFVVKLCTLVLDTDCPIMTVYLAIHHAILAFEFKLIDRIKDKYGKHKILGPSLNFAAGYQGNYDSTQLVSILADDIIESKPEDWIELEMQIYKFEVAMRNYPDTMYDTYTLDRIYELINQNPELAFYESVLCDYLAIRAHVDGARQPCHHEV